ncbi:MAG: EamA family transporter [Candidatus Aegiribacteria sp.]|nr:EamA family transporter [Candidatus Aegiribacteria sp.]MBD3294849.1 EamA family transporter [Candidatus Fermentibacteria bacterium]
MDRKTARAELLLLLTAAIWGFAFVAQRAGMDHMGPFLFNGLRFALGASVLAPFVLFGGKKQISCFWDLPLREGLIAGGVLFAGASLQQTGLVYTSAGNAGFVTGLYVVFVPVLGLFAGGSGSKRVWISGVIAAAGMFLLSGAGSAKMAGGDLIVLAGSVFWAVHIHVISRFMKKHSPLPLAMVQFGVCSLLSLLLALVTENWSWQGIENGAVPILYGGIISVGIAYTLQVVAQRTAPPAHAAVIMSLETLFAMFGGWLMLNEQVTLRGSAGGFMMLTAMVISARGQRKRKDAEGL